MKSILKILFICVLITSCELYEHSNPVDPKSSNFRDDGSNAELTLLGTTISRIRSEYDKPYLLKINIINSGVGSTLGTITGNLETIPRVKFSSPFFNTDIFRLNDSESYIDINPQDVLTASFKFTVPDSINLPTILKCNLNFRDKNQIDYQLKFNIAIDE